MMRVGIGMLLATILVTAMMFWGFGGDRTAQLFADPHPTWPQECTWHTQCHWQVVGKGGYTSCYPVQTCRYLPLTMERAFSRAS